MVHGDAGLRDAYQSVHCCIRLCYCPLTLLFTPSQFPPRCFHQSLVSRAVLLHGTAQDALHLLPRRLVHLHLAAEGEMGAKSLDLIHLGFYATSAFPLHAVHLIHYATLVPYTFLSHHTQFPPQ